MISSRDLAERFLPQHISNIFDWQNLNIVQKNCIISACSELIDLHRKYIKKHVKKDIDLIKLSVIVFKYYGIEPTLLFSKKRNRDIVQCRQISMYFAKMYTKYSHTNIGHILGGKDHATVTHAIKTVNNLIDSNRSFKEDIEKLTKKLKR